MSLHPNVGTIGHIDLTQRPAESLHRAMDLEQQPGPQVRFAPTHWPPRHTRMAIAVRLGITRMLLERSL